MIHHVPYPMKFFKEMYRILKPSGYLIIQEINASLLMRAILRLMRHEGYSFDINVFNEKTVCTNPEDLWSANVAIPNLLFDNIKNFQRMVPYFEVQRATFSEVFTFLNSGGVIAKTFHIPLPWFLLELLNIVDQFLCFLHPHIFALQRQIVLRKCEVI